MQITVYAAEMQLNCAEEGIQYSVAVLAVSDEGNALNIDITKEFEESALDTADPLPSVIRNIEAAAERLGHDSPEVKSSEWLDGSEDLWVFYFETLTNFCCL